MMVLMEQFKWQAISFQLVNRILGGTGEDLDPAVGVTVIMGGALQLGPIHHEQLDLFTFIKQLPIVRLSLGWLRQVSKIFKFQI